MKTELYNAATKGDVSFLNEARNKEIESGSDEYFLDQTSYKNNILHLAVRRQRFEFIKVVLNGLISTKAIDTLINQKNNDGNTPVHVAAEVGNMDIFKLLYDYLYGQKVRVYGLTVVREEEKVLWMQNGKGNMPLHVALINGNIEVAKLLVENHPGMTLVKNFSEETPLHLATIHQPFDVPIEDREAKGKAYLEMIKSLLEKENSVACWFDAKGSTPLHRAASITSAYNLKIIRLILDHCPQSAELRDSSSKTVLHHLKTIPSYKEGRDLLEIPEIYDLKDHQDEEGNTPLHAVAMNMNLNMVRVLLDSSAKQSIRNKDGISAASLIQDHFEETMEKNQMTMEVCEATDKANVSILKERLHNFGNNFLFSRDSKRRNVLHKLMHINEGTEIIKDDFVDFIKQVLESFPTFMGQVDINGDTPLHILMRNSPDTTIRYANSKLDENKFSTFSDSQLASTLIDICCDYFHKAEEEADKKGVRYYNRPWLMQNLEGNTPLHEALIANHNVSVMRKILELDIKTTAQLKNKLNETPLHLAAKILYSLYEQETGGVVEALAGANEEAAYTYDNNGLTPFLRAAQQGNIHTIGVLHEHFPDAARLADEKKGQTMWHLLVNHSPCSTWYLLKKYEALKDGITLKDYDGNTALHLAIQARQFGHATNFLDALKVDQMKNILDKENAAGVTPGDLIALAPDVPFDLEEILNDNREFIGYRSMYGISGADVDKYVNTIGVVATLLMTISFTTAFTVPGGLIQDASKGENKLGTPILMNEIAFQVFMFFDILTMCLSTMVLFCLFWIMNTNRMRNSVKLMDSCIFLLSISFHTTLWTFTAAVYATTIHVKRWIAIYTLVMCPLLTVLMHKYLVLNCIGPIGPSFTFYKNKAFKCIGYAIRFIVLIWRYWIKYHMCRLLSRII